MKKELIKSIVAASILALTYPAFASEITSEQVGDFLCKVQLCKNDAVISNIKLSKYNLANLSEKINGSGKQILKISFHQETPNGEYVRDFADCDLTVTASKNMSLSSCKITGTVKAGKSSRAHKLTLGEGEVMYHNESGWMASTLSNE